jgi:hypothetical protein
VSECFDLRICECQTLVRAPPFILFFSVLYGVKFFKVTTLVIVQVVDEEKSLDMLTKNG